MKDHVEIGHLNKYDDVKVNRHQVMDLDIRFKIRINVSNFETASLKTIYTLNIFYQCGDNCKIHSCTYYLKEAEMKIAIFAYFKEYHRNHTH